MQGTCLVMAPATDGLIRDIFPARVVSVALGAVTTWFARALPESPIRRPHADGRRRVDAAGGLLLGVGAGGLQLFIGQGGG